MEHTPNILLVEDDRNLGQLLKDYLELKGFDVTLQRDGENALKTYSEASFNICILDIMLPKLDGFELAKSILKLDRNAAIIFLTAKSQIEDLHKGFNIGADDYLTKPFNTEELLLRIRAILRRRGLDHMGNGQMEEKMVRFGNFELNVSTQILKHQAVEIRLTSKEAKLLEILAVNINQLVERHIILNTIWKDDSYFNARSMDVYISRLRKHLSADKAFKILNVHGEGFKLVEQ